MESSSVFAAVLVVLLIASPSASLEDPDTRVIEIDLHEVASTVYTTFSPFAYYTLQGSQLDTSSLKVTVDDINYQRFIRKEVKTQTVYSEWFDNNGTDAPKQGHFNKTTNEMNSYTWNIRRGLKTATNMAAAAGIPPVFDSADPVTPKTLSLEGVSSQTFDERKSYSVSHDIVIPPNTSVMAIWSLTETVVDVPFIFHVGIDGDVLFNVTSVRGLQSVKPAPIDCIPIADKRFEMTEDKDVSFTIHGIFTGIQVTQWTLTAEEHPFSTKKSTLLRRTKASKTTVLEKWNAFGDH